MSWMHEMQQIGTFLYACKNFLIKYWTWKASGLKSLNNVDTSLNNYVMNKLWYRSHYCDKVKTPINVLLPWLNMATMVTIAAYGHHGYIYKKAFEDCCP